MFTFFIFFLFISIFRRIHLIYNYEYILIIYLNFIFNDFSENFFCFFFLNNIIIYKKLIILYVILVYRSIFRLYIFKK